MTNEESTKTGALPSLKKAVSFPPLFCVPNKPA
jgi:hypothetical protein